MTKSVPSAHGKGLVNHISLNFVTHAHPAFTMAETTQVAVAMDKLILRFNALLW